MDSEGFEHDDHLSEHEKINIENAILEIAYDNSYGVLVKEVSFDDLLNRHVAQEKEYGYSALMAFDPGSGPKKEELENMIQYYAEPEREMYERCAKLNKIMNERYPNEV